ncbi:MAG TPA: hypothetical protein VHB79_34995 [Polyangiaceae bacterium]|nr:hypothetical protein [Polyangiaceae bacterium]
MTKSLISLLLLAAALPLGCSGEKEDPDPLETRTGFCQQWAEAACNQNVVDACNANSVDDCKASQAAYCLVTVPKNYRSSKYAHDCIAKVGDAYADGDLTAAELQVVTRLADPCDKLSTGTSDDGDSCDENDDCATVDGSLCIKKLGAAEGICGVPEEVGAGEACDGDNQVCDSDHYCNGENCVAYKKTDTGTCDADYVCKPEDRCLIATDATSGTCQARMPLSQACTSDDDCQSRYCAIAQGDTEGKCASKLRLGINEPLCENLR